MRLPIINIIKMGKIFLLLLFKVTCFGSEIYAIEEARTADTAHTTHATHTAHTVHIGHNAHTAHPTYNIYTL